MCCICLCYKTINYGVTCTLVVPTFIAKMDHVGETIHPPTKPARRKWTAEEEKELEILCCTKEITCAVKLSEKNKGLVHLRKLENIKKKVSNMIIKMKKKRLFRVGFQILPWVTIKLWLHSLFIVFCDKKFFLLLISLFDLMCSHYQLRTSVYLGTMSCCYIIDYMLHVNITWTDVKTSERTQFYHNDQAEEYFYYKTIHFKEQVIN